MATKNLARSAVEGGRHRYGEYANTRAERQQVRAFCDPANDFDARPAPRREKGDDSFRDRLRPLDRWLRSNVGRPWNGVFSELCKRFDRRSLKGWHLVDAHAKRTVYLPSDDRVVAHTGALKGGPRWYFSDSLWVDSHGILRYTPRSRKRR